MSGFLLDANVLLDIATADATWLAWSEGQFRAADAQGPILINTYFPSVAIITP